MFRIHSSKGFSILKDGVTKPLANENFGSFPSV